MKFNMKIDEKLRLKSNGDEKLYSCLVEIFINALEGKYAYTEFYREVISKYAKGDDKDESN